MTCSIYKITNIINNKIYIGQTWSKLSQRFSQHNCKSNKCVKLKRAFQKYGRDKFKIELIVSCQDQETANIAEKFWISYHNSIDSGYNIKEGGSCGKHSKETKIKMSLAQAGNKNHFFGKNHSNEAKKKMSVYRKGKPSTYKGKTILTIDKENIILSLYREGMSILKISQKIDHSNHTVKKFLIRKGILL